MTGRRKEDVAIVTDPTTRIHELTAALWQRYGAGPQLAKFDEECRETLEALEIYLASPTPENLHALALEFADLAITRHYLGRFLEQQRPGIVRRALIEKLDRLQARMTKGEV